MAEITREQIEELCKRVEARYRDASHHDGFFTHNLRVPDKDCHEAAALIRRLVAERDEAREELDIWRSVFPDIAPESVVPNRSLLESRAIAAEAEVERLRAALERIYREGDGWNEHRPEEGKYAGTTGEGHARCREIASAALEGKSDDK